MHALSEGFEQRGRDDLAIVYARRAAQADPLHEAFQRSLMRLLYRTGDKASAVTEFNRFAQLAKSELGVEPDRETIALVREIRQPSPPFGSSETLKPVAPISIRPERIPLVGRDTERLELNTLLDSAMAARGGGVLLVGEAGIGKSKLADWVIEEWAARGGAAGRGRCIEFNDPVPYQPLLDALGSFVDEGDLTGFVSGDGRPTAHFLDETVGRTVGQPAASEELWPPGKLRLFAGLCACLEDASQRRPLLAVIEDLQWADASTVDFLAYLLERARNMRLAVLLTSRTAGAARHAPYLERLSRHCSGTMRLGRLTMPETIRLVKFLLDSAYVSPDIAKWVYAETEGHPLFVVETLRLLHRQSDFGAPGSKSSTDSDRSLFPGQSDRIPDGVRSAVEQRLALIESDVLRVVQIASVLGRSFDDELLGAVVGVRRNRLSRTILHLLREGLLEREGAGYRFTHDKIRAICYESLPLRSRRAFHGRAAAALVQAPDVPVHQLAWHQSSAGQWNLAATSWEQAGDHARRVHAYEEALRAFGHAITCTWKDAATTEERELREADLLVKSDEVLETLGRPADRRGVLERLGVLSRKGARDALRARWLVRRALLEEHVANFQTAGTLARRAWYIGRIAGDASVQFEGLRVLARAMYQCGRFQRSLAISRLALGRVAGQRSRAIVTALWQAASTCYLTGNYALAASFLERGMRISTELELDEESHYVMFGRAILEKFAGEIRASRACLVKVMQFAKQHGDALLLARASPHRSSVDAYEGRLGDALRSLRAGILASRSTGHFRTHVSCLNEVANGVGRLLGNFQWAWDASNHALNLSGAADKLLIRAMCRDSQAALLIDEGRIDEAAVVIDEVLRLQEQGKGSFGPAQEYLARRGAIRLELGNLTGAIADLEQAKSVQVRVGVRSALVDTLTYLSMAYAKLGYADRA
ncbi:MAG TPA: AAA family ATPase, partial [Nitrospiraceae bacterium]|nr:AAA family ATPase [Nitrospiraceae bacterium]